MQKPQGPRGLAANTMRGKWAKTGRGGGRAAWRPSQWGVLVQGSDCSAAGH